MLKPWHFLLAAFLLVAGYSAPIWWLASQLHPSQRSTHIEMCAETTDGRTTCIVKKDEDYLEKVFDPLAIAAYVLAGVTCWLAVVTRGLFTATAQSVADARNAAKKRRSIVRGSVKIHKPGQRLTIEASNSGETAAIIKRVSWRIAEFGDWERRPYPRNEPSGEVVPGPERAKPIKVVSFEEAEGFTNPVLIFRFDYTDVNQGKTDAFIEHAMFIKDKNTPEEAVFVDVPSDFPDFLRDNFRVEIGPKHGGGCKKEDREAET